MTAGAAHGALATAGPWSGGPAREAAGTGTPAADRRPIRLRPRWLTHNGHGLRSLAAIERDLKMMRLVAAGHERQEVAVLMAMPVNSVRWNLSRLRIASDTRTMTQFFVVAAQAGLFDEGMDEAREAAA